MSAEQNLSVARQLAEAYAVADVASIDRLLASDVVFHVPGRHPLSGTYVGKDAVFGYLARVAAISDGAAGGFDIHSLTADDDHVVGLLTGTIEHAGVQFVRPVVHVFHVNGSQVTEFWEASLDQHAEDAFWVHAAR